jgi:hypothetical protein
MRKPRKPAAPADESLPTLEEFARAAGDRTPHPGPPGVLVPERPFPAELRQALEKILRWARPRLEAGAIATIIGQLREVDDVVSVLRAGTEPVADAILLGKLVVASRRLRSALVATMEKGLLDGAKARLGYAGTVDQQMVEGLDILAELTVGARPRPRHPKGGRPRGGAARGGSGLAYVNVPLWFAAEVATVLRAHGVQPSEYQDGRFADILRTLWPHVMKVELTGDIRRLLRSACRTN